MEASIIPFAPPSLSPVPLTGRIGIYILPGQEAVVALSGPHDRDLTSDLDVIAKGTLRRWSRCLSRLNSRT
jgi:hypothetical protein